MIDLLALTSQQDVNAKVPVTDPYLGDLTDALFKKSVVPCRFVVGRPPESHHRASSQHTHKMSGIQIIGQELLLGWL